MLKFRYGLLGFFLFSSAQAATFVRMSCVTEYPTTSFLIEREDGIVTVRLYHHHGTRFAPIHNGMITPTDIPVLEERALMVHQLGNEAVFQFAASDCEMKEHWRQTGVFACFHGQKTRLGGHEVSPYAIYSTHKTETSFAGIHEKVAVSAYLEIQGKTYPITMEYLAEECGLGSNAAL